MAMALDLSGLGKFIHIRIQLPSLYDGRDGYSDRNVFFLLGKQKMILANACFIVVLFCHLKS